MGNRAAGMASKLRLAFQHYRGLFYKKSLILILLSASIPGLAIGGGVYWLVTGKIQSELIHSHQKQMSEQFGNIDAQINYLELTLSHWAFEPRFGESLKTLDFVYSFAETRDINKTLLVMQGSHPLIKQVELFVDGLTPVRMNPEYNPFGDAGQIAYYRQLLNEGGAAYWTNSSRLPARSAANDAVLVHKIMDLNQHPFGVLVATLNRDKLDNMLAVLNPYDKGTTFLMDRNHEVFSAVRGRNTPADEFEAALQAAVVKEGRAAGSFLLNWNRDDYSVSFGSLLRIDTEWIYVSAAPISAITSPIIRVSQLILVFSLSGLLLALLLSWLASRRIYLPVKRLMGLLAGGKNEGVLDEFQLLERQWGDLSRESSLLQSKLREQLPYVKESFLLQLFHHHLNRFSEAELRNRMKRYGWEVDNRQFIAAHVRLTGFAQADGRFGQEDRGLATFAAANIIQELVSSRMQSCHVFNLHDWSVGILVIATDAAAERAEFLNLAGELTQAINQILRFRVTIAICRSTDALRAIPVLFDEAVQVSWTRMVEGMNQWIDMEQPDATSGADNFRYPFALEQDIVLAARMGRQQEAQQLVVRFVNEVSDGGNKEVVVRQSLLLLLSSIQHMILQSGVYSGQQPEEVNLFEKLMQIGEREQRALFINERIISPFIAELSERSNTQIVRIVEQARSYVDTHYFTDLSLESCADRLGTNPYTLSKAFKQTTGVNFIDYLTGLRLSKAKELLRETDKRMNEVAEAVGYQQTYFNRIFKKLEGVTPGQYRERSQSHKVQSDQ